jgi:hypothetical protein
MGLLNDWAFARYMSRRTTKRSSVICRRKSDGSLWASSSPQNFGLAMRGLVNGTAGWHFAKVRIWRGVPIISRKVFWAFNTKGQFEIVQRQDGFWLPAWPEPVESAMIAASAATVF